MRFFLSRHPLTTLILLIIISNLTIYLSASLFHSFIPFNSHNYYFESHHLIPDTRTTTHHFDLVNALGQFDSQWYLKIASTGYPPHPTLLDFTDRTIMSSLTYAFFPLYPLLLHLLNLPFNQFELTAFLLSNLLIVVNAISLYYVVKKLISPQVALKATLITFLLPFSLFFRSYYPEGLQLFLLIWFAYFLIQKKFILSALFLSLLNITKGNLLLLNFVYLFFAYKQYRYGPLPLKKVIFNFLLLSLPFSFWLLFNYRQTNNFLFFFEIQKYWSTGNLPPLLANIITILHFTALKFHLFHSSIIDSLSVIIIFFLLTQSRRLLLKEFWLVSFVLWFTPLITKSLMSFSRLQIISFPLSIFIALIFPPKYFVILTCVSYLLLLITSVFFVNWYWVG